MTATIAPPPILTVVALASDALASFEFGVAVEVVGLHRPDFDAWYRFAVCAERRGDLRAVGGFTVRATAGLATLARAGTIVIPGWRGAETPVPPAILSAIGCAAADDLLGRVRARPGRVARRAARASEAARRMVAPPHREGGQAQFIPRPMPPKPGRFPAAPDRPRARLGTSPRMWRAAPPRVTRARRAPRQIGNPSPESRPCPST